MMSFGDKTVKGLPVSTKASTGFATVCVLRKKVTKGKGLLPIKGLIEQRILGKIEASAENEGDVFRRDAFYK